jgi:hypothetical protein
MPSVSEKKKKAEKSLMDIRRMAGFILVCLVLTVSFYIAPAGSATQIPTSVAEKTSGVPGYSPHNPTPVGLSAVARIEYNTGYIFQVTRAYEAKITLLEIVRGENAWERIKAADSSNRPPGAGFEYILARIRFELFLIEDVDRKGYELRTWRFIAVSSDGKYYDTSGFLPVAPQEPELSADLRPGDSCEGWTVFLVREDDDKPLMNFGRAALSNDDGYPGVWFQLY